MENIAVQLLMMLSAILGVQSIPENTEHWIADKEWAKNGNHYKFSATSTELTKLCENSPEKWVDFPLIIHGTHQVFGDGKLILESGRADFSHASGFYNSPSISCQEISQHAEIKWVTYGYSKYFSRFKFFPKIIKFNRNNIFKSITLNIISAGGLLMLAIFSLVVFFNKVTRSLAINIIGTCLFFAVYFVFVASGFFAIETGMLMAHKLADFGLWVGSLFFFNALLEREIISKNAFYVFLGSAFFACVLIFFGTNGDVVQLGTTIPFPIVLSLLVIAFLGQWKIYQQSEKTSNLLQVLSILSFSIAALYDIFVITGLIDGIPLFSVGVMFALITFTLAVNDEITQTYKERDGLLHSLGEKVEEKTLGLRQALMEKEQAQAELIQSAKLASLGTLSAGIAHEINNSINYVNGAIHPLEMVIKDVEMEDKQKILVMKLLKSIKEGSKMTVDIVRSLRNYTGLNQAKYCDVSLHETTENVLTILKNRFAGKIDVINKIDPAITLFSNKVGLNQILMNLISNALDAVGDKGKVEISVAEIGDSVILSVSDNGPGIPPELKGRIFDPFFTTKDVGQGTGLGLHIVKKEIENHQGKIEVKSEPSGGTEFLVTLPKYMEKDSQEGAA